MDIPDIDHLARLARLSLTDDEKADFSQSFPAILDYFSKLQEVDMTQVEAKPYLTDAVNAWRSDDITDMSAERAAAHAGFPKEHAGALEVPAVFE